MADLRQVAEGVLVHESDFVQSNAVVVQGRAGILLVDPGVQDHELTCLAAALDRPVVAGFSTHPHWDHLLWHAHLGTPPRYGTPRCADTVRDELAAPNAKTEIINHLAGTGIEDNVSLDLYGQITALPADTTHLSWDGPSIRIIEHEAHAPGHAALFLENQGVLIAGDMLSDVLIPMLDPQSSNPIESYLAALDLLEEVALNAGVVIPGHGAVGGPGETRARIELDRAYVLALAAGRTPDDPRIGPSAEPGWEWVSDVHAGQAQRLASP